MLDIGANVYTMSQVKRYSSTTKAVLKLLLQDREQTSTSIARQLSITAQQVRKHRNYINSKDLLSSGVADNLSDQELANNSSTAVISTSLLEQQASMLSSVLSSKLQALKDTDDIDGGGSVYQLSSSMSQLLQSLANLKKQDGDTSALYAKLLRYDSCKALDNEILRLQSMIDALSVSGMPWALMFQAKPGVFWVTMPI